MATKSDRPVTLLDGRVVLPEIAGLKPTTDTVLLAAAVDAKPGMCVLDAGAGSGAGAMVPVEMVRAVSEYVSIPVIAGGGIRRPEDAAERAEAGASFIVVGSVLEQRVDRSLIRSFADAIHKI